jgi:nucleoside-diphosphate-sugar epimerase
MDAVDHVVLGAGAGGMAIAEALARRGESVRVVNRSGLREPMAGVQSVAGDITDPAFAAAPAAGARVIYQALNPPYHRWAQEFPGLQAAAIATAQATGARLVVWTTSTCTDGPTATRSPRIGPTTPTPARVASVPRWPGT